MQRGPYKRYEYEPNVKLPKTTSYNRRKRQYEDIDCEPITNTVSSNTYFIDIVGFMDIYVELCMFMYYISYFDYCLVDIL